MHCSTSAQPPVNKIAKTATFPKSEVMERLHASPLSLLFSSLSSAGKAAFRYVRKWRIAKATTWSLLYQKPGPQIRGVYGIVPRLLVTERQIFASLSFCHLE